MQKAIWWASKRCKLGRWTPAGIVSVLITTINDPYLEATVENLKATASGPIEVLVAEDDKREGRRVVLNRLARRAKGERLFFVDSHCQMSDGWDVALKEACGEREIVFGRIGSWRPESAAPLGEAAYGLVRLDEQLGAKWWGQADNRYRRQSLAESMGMTGCGFMMHKAWFETLGGFDEQLGPYGGTGAEWSLKTWLAGGRLLLVNGVTCWHKFETNKDDALYPVDRERLAATFERIRTLTAAKAWPGQVRPVAWLFEKFGDAAGKGVTQKVTKTEILFHGAPGVLNVGADPFEATRALVAPLGATRLVEVQVCEEAAHV